MKSIIKDPLFGPFEIKIQQLNYVVYQQIEDNPEKVKGRDRKEENKNKIYTKAIGYYSKFPDAVYRIFREKLDMSKDEFSSLEEYVKQWKAIKDEMKEVLSKLITK